MTWALKGAAQGGAVPPSPSAVTSSRPPPRGCATRGAGPRLEPVGEGRGGAEHLKGPSPQPAAGPGGPSVKAPP